MAEPTYTLRDAGPADAEDVAALVDAAYAHYVERIGGPPGPMTLDYEEVLARDPTTVAELDGTVVGVLVLTEDDEGFCISNVAVHPEQRGRGLGRELLEHAEAAGRSAGYGSIYLFTHEGMTENLALYRRIGYAEYARRERGGATLVFLRKPL
jgi:ribosomal protein S18 acetylase RimI-like enzyme